MTEIFKNIPDYIRAQAKGWVDLALKQSNPYTAVQMVFNYRDACLNEEEKAFVDFYFQSRIEELKNEKYSNDFSEEPTWERPNSGNNESNIAKEE